MKTEKNILIAFVLNLAFSLFEFIGGILTGSVAIISDAIHDMGDALSIGVSYTLEKVSTKQPDAKYTYGYARYSLVGSVITTLILIVGSFVIIVNASLRMINPIEINYNGMMIFAVIGVCVNFVAAFVTSEGDSLNQKAVKLHMLEDVLGWIVVLIGAVIMRFTDFLIIDSGLSIAVAVFILINALKNLKGVLDLFLEKTPHGISVEEIRKHLLKLDGVLDVHHIHIWSMDGQNNYATMHIVTNADTYEIKKLVREELSKNKIFHATLELEAEGEECCVKSCHTEVRELHVHHHHH